MYGLARKPSCAAGVIPVAAIGVIEVPDCRACRHHAFFCAHPFQLLFLAGAVCLVVAHGLRPEVVGHPPLWACVQLFSREPQAISFASGLVIIRSAEP